MGRTWPARRDLGEPELEQQELTGYWTGERRTCGPRWTDGAVVNPEIRDGKVRAERRQGP